jgi:hypothetical protein
MTTVDTGGVDIGPIGTAGARGGGGMPGLNSALKFASRTPEWQTLFQQAQMGKDFNDQPTGWLAGSSTSSAGTTPVYGPSQGGPVPGGGGSWGDLGELGGFAPAF